MVEDLIRQARRRFILNEALAQGAFAASVLAAGVILVLLIGTRYLSAWSLTVFAVAGLVAGILRLRRLTPDPYATAVRLDENARLHDALSTAFHFSHEGDAALPAAAAFQKLQREQAEQAARTVSVSASLPFQLPRTAYAMAALGVAALALVGMRYRIGQGLDLQRPITEVLFEDQNALRTKAAAKSRNAGSQGEWSEQAQDLMAKLGIKPEMADADGDKPDALNKALQEALKTQDLDGMGAQTEAPKTPQDAKGGAQSADSQAKNDSFGAADKGVDVEKAGAKPESKGGNGSSGKNGQQGSAAEDSFLSKLRSAAQSMFSKNGPPSDQPPPKGKQPSTPSADKQSNPQAGPGQGTPENSGGDQDTDETDPNGSAMGGQKGKSNDTTASNTPQHQEGTGIGLADGSKDIKQAEELQAMGKLSEIIGRRSAAVSGDTTIEVESGKQQLKTGYTKAEAAHSETDGDVTRDEIPLALQPYVQQYFADVHKGDAGAADTKKNTEK